MVTRRPLRTTQKTTSSSHKKTHKDTGTTSQEQSHGIVNLDKVATSLTQFAERKAIRIGAGILMAILFIVGVVVDIFMPMNGVIYTVTRSVVSLTFGASLFLITWSIAHYIHDCRVVDSMNDGIVYVEYRLRFSPRKRRLQSMVIGAILAMLALVTYITPVYTVTAGVILTVLADIVFYNRLTPDEKVNAQYNIPDPRDVQDDFNREVQALDEQAMQQLRDDIVKSKENQLKNGDDAGDYHNDVNDYGYSDSDIINAIDEYNKSK